MQLFIPFVVFSGFIMGWLLKKYIPEELEEMQAVRLWAEVLLLSLLVGVLIGTVSWTLWAIPIILIGIISAFFLREIYLYAACALLSFEFLPASVLFLYGLVGGEKKRIISTALFFFIPFGILFFTQNIQFFSFFALGGIATILGINSYSLASKEAILGMQEYKTLK